MILPMEDAAANPGWASRFCIRNSCPAPTVAQVSTLVVIVFYETK
jgi:hypothetical protein